HFSGTPVSGGGNCATVAACTTLYSSTLFGNTTLLALLNPLNANPIGLANQLATTQNESLFAANRVAAGIPVNFWVVNPGKRGTALAVNSGTGGAFLIDNNNQTWYDAVTVEFRRRMAKGLLLQANYTFGKALANAYASSSSVFDQPATIRDFHLRKDV